MAVTRCVCREVPLSVVARAAEAMRAYPPCQRRSCPSSLSKPPSGPSSVARSWSITVSVEPENRPHIPAYDRRLLEVLVESSGDIEEAITYLADVTYIDRDLRPYDWYLALILAGAREHHLPGAYIDRLETIQTATDPNPDRPSRLEALTLLDGVSKLTRPSADECQEDIRLSRQQRWPGYCSARPNNAFRQSRSAGARRPS